jgi:glucan phosphoethanolaminetransferase (alkaline phosphatase superfamily)
MIQRKQSVFLALAALLGIIIFFLDIALIQISVPEKKTVILHFASLEATGVTIVQPFFYNMIMIFDVLIVALCIYTIFEFANRPKQIKLCRGVIFLIVLLIGCMFLITDKLKGQFTGSTIFYLYALYVPIVMLVLVFLAIQGISADEKLVRSADRLR